MIITIKADYLRFSSVDFYDWVSIDNKILGKVIKTDYL